MSDNLDRMAGSSGFCKRCSQVHFLGADEAVPHCLELMEILDREERIDFAVPEVEADPVYGTGYLFGPARGQMFGVMVYCDRHGEKHTARAFSGQYNSRWNAPGFVPPIIDESEFHQLTYSTERKIKQLGAELSGMDKNIPEYRLLVEKRREFSRGLMLKIHDLYTVANFRDEFGKMSDIAATSGGLPTGTGDCCAPKLLNFAARNGFRPVSIAEFYYGLENRSGSKEHKKFYSSCTEKCGLILGFMLCGL